MIELHLYSPDLFLAYIYGVVYKIELYGAPVPVIRAQHAAAPGEIAFSLPLNP